MDIAKKIPLSSSRFYYYLIAFSLALLTLIISIIYALNNEKNEIKFFDEKEFVFNEFSFNRSIVYKNKYSVESNLFLKQALFYISGKVLVSFDPKLIKYNSDEKTVHYDGELKYTIDAKYDILDLLEPEPLTTDQAAKISPVIGLLGAVAGAEIASFILPSTGLSQLTGAVAGAVIGGVSATYFTFKLLDGFNVQEKLSEKEKNEVFKAGKELIKASINQNNHIKSLVLKNFENNIRSNYMRQGIVLKQVIVNGGVK